MEMECRPAALRIGGASLWCGILTVSIPYISMSASGLL